MKLTASRSPFSHHTVAWAIGALLLAGLLLAAPWARGVEGDFDADGIEDGLDNCVEASNPPQTDSDGDGFGNACDADYDNDGIVRTADFLAFGRNFAKTALAPDFNPIFDADDDGRVGGSDYLLFGRQFGGPPGPAGSGSGAALAAAATGSDIQIANFQLVRKTRVSRYEFDYTYRADAVNGTNAYLGVTAQVASNVPTTTLVDDHLTFGDVPPLASVPSADTFTLRQDRRFPFSFDDLAFEIRITGPGTIPVDPADVAPPLDPTVATTLFASTEFLYSGPDAVQTGLNPAVIEERRAAVVRGEVRDRAGDPLPGAMVSVLDHPEFGETFTRADGFFDLVVNGGGVVTVRIEKAGFLPAQRQLQARWGEFGVLEPVVLVALDPVVTPVDLASATAMQVAQGSVVADQDGSRQATVLFPAGAQATMRLPDGSTQALPQMTFRATEYTVGDSGPQAMPAELPPSSAYTYAVELSADEAIAANAKSVEFTSPVVSYTENFVGFPVGSAIPVGTYDADSAVWVPQENGLVVGVLSETAGLADLDVNGSGAPASASALSALGITNAERAQLASLYAPGQSLWRVEVSHFSPLDFNAPVVLPPGSEEPRQPPPKNPTPETSCELPGSLLECESQVLGESLPIVGTPFTLNYRTSRVPGRTTDRTIAILLNARSTIPGPLEEIRLEIEIAGQRHELSFPPAPRLSTTFTWDGNDAYGRPVQGEQTARVRILYVYPTQYASPPSSAASVFGRPSPPGGIPVPGRISRARIQDFKVQVGTFDARAFGLGGWSLDVHHLYEPVGRKLLLGTGERRRGGEPPLQRLEIVAGGFLNPVGDVVAEPDGSIVSAVDLGWVTRVTPDGSIHYIAGTGLPSAACRNASAANAAACMGDGGPATSAKFQGPQGLARGPDGSIYVADSLNHRVRRIAPDGTIHTVAGSGGLGTAGGGFAGDGGPATAALLREPWDVAVDPEDGTLFIAEFRGHRVRRVGPDGIINVYAGNGQSSNQRAGEDGPAVQAQVVFPHSLALAPDGTLYIAEPRLIHSVDPDGILRRFSGLGFTGAPDDSPDGTDRFSARFNIELGLAWTAQGDLLVGDRYNHKVKIVRSSRPVNVVAGTGTDCFFTDVKLCGYGNAAPDVSITWPRGVAQAPDGSVLIGTGPFGSFSVLRVRPMLPDLSVDQATMPSEDGTELYIFDPAGRHLRTHDTLTGATLYAFGYDASGLLETVTDVHGNLTTIERDSAGSPTALLAPFGQRTSLRLNGEGFLDRLTNPAGEAFQFSYTPEGLLTRLTDPRGFASTFEYDEMGRLTRDTNAEGGFVQLSRTDPNSSSHTVTTTTALGRTTTYGTSKLASGDVQRVVTTPTGFQATSATSDAGASTVNLTDGVSIASTIAPDPRWGLRAPIEASRTESRPGGVSGTGTQQVTASLANPLDPLSLATLSVATAINGRVYNWSYNGSSRTITASTPAGRTRVTRLDAQGKPLEVQPPGLFAYRYAYDARGRLIQIARGSGSLERVTTLSYGPDGRVASEVDPLGRSTTIQRDAAGRPLRVTLPDLQEIARSYDPAGNLVVVAPPGRPAHQFLYDGRNRFVAYHPPLLPGGATPIAMSFDLDGRMTARVAPEGELLTTIYDATTGMPSSLDFGADGLAIAYHPGTDRVASVSGPNGATVSFSWDGPLPVSTTWSGAIAGTVHWVLDDDLRVAQENVNGVSPAAFSYDLDGLLTAAGPMTISRDPVSGLVAGTSVGGVTTSRSYTSFGELGHFTARFAGTAFFDVSYERDKLGRITRMVELVQGLGKTSDFEYDLAGRLANVSENGVLVRTYVYDANGNRVARGDSTGTTFGSYDAQDRLVTWGSASYAYSGAGRLRSILDGAVLKSYAYDAIGNLRGVTLPDGTAITYLVDGLGRRVGRRVDGTFERGWLHQGSRIVAELDAAGNLISRFVYGTRANVPDLMIRAGAVYQIIADHVGSVRLVVNAVSGAVAQRIAYDEFGRVSSDSSPDWQPFGFAGGHHDGLTGLVRFGARDYDPAAGRFTARDPILFRGSGTNLYSYARSNPVNLIDPTGLQSIPCDPGTYTSSDEECSWYDPRCLLREMCEALGICGDSPGGPAPPGPAPDADRAPPEAPPVEGEDCDPNVDKTVGDCMKCVPDEPPKPCRKGAGLCIGPVLDCRDSLTGEPCPPGPGGHWKDNCVYSS